MTRTRPAMDRLDPSSGLTPPQCKEFFLALRKVAKEEVAAVKAKEKAKENVLKKDTAVSAWLDKRDDARAMCNMMAQKNERDSFILGFQLLTDIAKFHSPERNDEVGNEIYRFLS